jgi:HEAT repeat protein
MLGQLPTHDDRVVPALIEALKQDGPYVGFYAARSLGRLGSRAKEAIARLVEVMHDRALKSNLRQQAAMALGKLDPQGRQVVPDLEKSLQDPDIYVVIGAAIALGEMGPEAAGAARSLREALDSARDEGVKTHLSKALKRIETERE